MSRYVERGSGGGVGWRMGMCRGAGSLGGCISGGLWGYVLRGWGSWGGGVNGYVSGRGGGGRWGCVWGGGGGREYVSVKGEGGGIPVISGSSRKFL